MIPEPVLRFGPCSRYLWGSMVTYYCISIEEALRRAKAAGKKPGCYYGGIILPGGRRGFAVYKDGKAFEQYTSYTVKA